MTVELGSTDRNLFGGVRKKCTTTSTDQTKISFSKSDEAPSSDYRCTSFLLLGGSAALDLHEDGGEDKIRRRPDVSGRASEVKASESIDRVHSMVRDISSQLTQGFNTPRPSTEIYLVGPSTINPPSIKFSSAPRPSIKFSAGNSLSLVGHVSALPLCFLIVMTSILSDCSRRQPFSAF